MYRAERGIASIVATRGAPWPPPSSQQHTRLQLPHAPRACANTSWHSRTLCLYRHGCIHRAAVQADAAETAWGTLRQIGTSVPQIFDLSFCTPGWEDLDSGFGGGHSPRTHRCTYGQSSPVRRRQRRVSWRTAASVHLLWRRINTEQVLLCRRTCTPHTPPHHTVLVLPAPVLLVRSDGFWVSPVGHCLSGGMTSQPPSSLTRWILLRLLKLGLILYHSYSHGL